MFCQTDALPGIIGSSLRRPPKLLLLELGEQERVLAGLGQFREMAPHAGLDTPAAWLSAGAFLLGVGLARLGDRHVT
jgi:hypothetical protein